MAAPTVRSANKEEQWQSSSGMLVLPSQICSLWFWWIVHRLDCPIWRRSSYMTDPLQYSNLSALLNSLINSKSRDIRHFQVIYTRTSSDPYFSQPVKQWEHLLTPGVITLSLNLCLMDPYQKIQTNLSLCSFHHYPTPSKSIPTYVS